jgi:hypothetical protein
VVATSSAALWLIPKEAFHRSMYEQRGAWVRRILSQCSDPGQAFDNWMQRDIAFAGRIASQAARMGWETLTVDGSKSIEENAERVAAHFGELLTD